MINVTKHGIVYEKNQLLKQTHLYKCGYFRATNTNCGGCGCEFTATLKDFDYKVVGHGEMDYVTECPECGHMIYDSINRVD